VVDSSDHARALFSAVVPDRRDLLETVLTKLTEDHFPEDRWRHFFKMFKWYYDYAGDVLTKNAIEAILAKLPSAETNKVILYQTTYDSLMSQKSSESDFKWSLHQLNELYAQSSVKRTFKQGMDILTRGIEDSKGNEVKGHEAAREYVMAQLGVIDQRLTVQEAPDGDIREEEDDMLSEYESKKESFLSGEFSGIEFGIPKLDSITGGLQPGELDFILGYASAGKSSLCCQLAWQAAVRQKKNVVYVTTETLRSQIRRKLVSRHSRLKKFGLAEGLNSLDLKRGNLDAELEEKLREVVHDFSHSEDYGKLRVMQASESMTVNGMKVRLQAIQREFPIDLLIVDALYILKPETRRASDREQLNERIEQAMILAKTFDNGNGLAVVSPWQASRKAKEDADREGYYGMSALAETSYAERYADGVIGILESQQRNKLSMSVVKWRDGEQAPPFDIDVDYATCFYTDSGRTQHAANTALLNLGLGL
jgi:replicative DNA helicase